MRSSTILALVPRAAMFERFAATFNLIGAVNSPFVIADLRPARGETGGFVSMVENPTDPIDAPEPGSLALFAGGLAAIFGSRRPRDPVPTSGRADQSIRT